MLTAGGRGSRPPRASACLGSTELSSSATWLLEAFHRRMKQEEEEPLIGALIEARAPHHIRRRRRPWLGRGAWVSRSRRPPPKSQQSRAGCQRDLQNIQGPGRHRPHPLGGLCRCSVGLPDSKSQLREGCCEPCRSFSRQANRCNDS